MMGFRIFGIWNLEYLRPSQELITHARHRVWSWELTGGRKNTILLAQFSKQESRTGWMDIFYLLNVLSISHWCLQAAELRSIGRHTVARWEWKMRLRVTLVKMQRYMFGRQAVRPRPSHLPCFSCVIIPVLRPLWQDLPGYRGGSVGKSLAVQTWGS